MKQTKKAKVVKAEFKRQYDGAKGTTYYHTIEFDNGDKGEYGSKSRDQEKFVVGQEADYEIEERVNGNYTNYYIKPIYSGSVGGHGASRGGSRAGNESFALSYAKDIACAHISNGKEFKSEQVLTVADAFYKWLEEKKK